MTNIKTVLHAYWFDVSDTEQQRAYLETIERIQTQFTGRPWTVNLEAGYTADPKAWDFSQRIADIPGAKGESGAAIELETKYLFNDQWNSAPMPGFDNGARLFNWTQYSYLNKRIKAGYWIEQTAEMAEVLRNTHKCGYCGALEPAAKGYVFCPHCLDSEYLKVADLHLTRMVPVINSHAPRAPLTEAERAHLMPQYQEAQKNGATERGKKRIAAARRRIESEFTQTVADATEKRDAARWLMDNAPGFLDNWIFYTHTARHCFGWRSALDSEQLEILLGVISEFPFAYEIVCADGRKLSN